MRKVLTIGTFDILHFGHVAFLRECEKLSNGLVKNELVVGVNSDRFVCQFKPAPIMNEAERLHALDQLGFETRLNDSPGRDLIEQESPGILAIGSDWARKDYLSQIDCTQDWLDEQRIILAYIPYVQALPISSTEIRERVLARNR